MRLSVTLRRPGGVGQPPARLRGTMENGPTGQMRSSNHPPACGAGCARVRKSRFGVWPHGKAHSVPGGSRKDAFWLLPHGKTHSPSPHHQNPQFDGSGDCRMRFSDRRMRFSDRRMRFSVTFRNHPDCIALSRHLRNPLTTPSHVRGGHRNARRRLRASAQSKGIRPPARHGSRTRVWHRRPRQAQRPQALAPS